MIILDINENTNTHLVEDSAVQPCVFHEFSLQRVKKMLGKYIGLI